MGKENTRKAKAFMVAAIIVFVLSALTLTLYNQALNANLYKNALAQSQIYDVTADILETEVSEAVVAWEKNALEAVVGGELLGDKPVIGGSLNFVLGYVIEKQTPQLVGDIFEKIQVATVLQNMVEAGIDRDIAWLRGERKAAEIFQYIPTPEQIEELQGSDLTEVISMILEPKIEAKKEEILPVCETNVEVVENVQRLVKGDASNVTCTSPRIRELEKEIVTSEPVVNTVGSVQTKVGEVLASERVNNVFADIMGASLVLANAKKDMMELRDTLQFIHSTAVFFVFVSIGLAIASIVYTPKDARMRAFSHLLMISGGLLFAYALIHYFLLSSMVTRALPYDEISFGTKVLTEADGMMLTDSIRSASLYIVRGLAAQTFAMGALLLIIGGWLYAILTTYKHRHTIAAKGREMKKKAHDAWHKE